MKSLRNTLLGIAAVLGLFGWMTNFAHAADGDTVKARIVRVVSEREERIEGTDAKILEQEVEAQIKKGENKGDIVRFTTDYSRMKVGDTFFLKTETDDAGQPAYSVSDFERRPQIYIFLGLFILLVIGFGRMQGIRSLVSLGISMLVIFFVLIPLLLKGHSPVLVSTIAATGILFFAIFFTHGFNRKSAIAFVGTVSAVVITGILASIAVKVSHITGFASQEAVSLNFNTGGSLDFVGLFLASIIIGMLGVLDDISITQVAVVRELYAVAPHLSKREIFASAIRVGKEHVGALVNTLVLAYVGVALPMILYVASAMSVSTQTINAEVFASEILRTILGSIGLILTVPITTVLAVWFLADTKGKKMTLDELDHGHAHSHGHGHSH